MPQFFFDITDGSSCSQDDTGLDLARLENAKMEAAVALAHMLAESVAEPGPKQMFIVVRDEARHPLARLTLSLATEDFG